MPAADPKTPLNRRASMPVPSSAMGPPESTPSSSRAPRTRSPTRTTRTPSFSRPPKRDLSPYPPSSPLTALSTSGEVSSPLLVTPARPKREYGKHDSPFIPDIHPTPIRRQRRTPVRRHSSVNLRQLRDGIPGDDRLVSDKKYRAQQREHTAWMLVTQGTLSSSPGIKIEEVADEDSDEADRENFDEWSREERRKRRVAEEREMERRRERREVERREMKESRRREKERKEQEKREKGREEMSDEEGDESAE